MNIGKENCSCLVKYYDALLAQSLLGLLSDAWSIPYIDELNFDKTVQ